MEIFFSEILSALLGVFFFEVLQQKDMQKNTNQNNGLF